MIQAFLGLSSQLGWISHVDIHILRGVLQPDIVWDRACCAGLVDKLDVCKVAAQHAQADAQIWSQLTVLIVGVGPVYGVFRHQSQQSCRG